jgi:hypothetical protein
VATGPTGFTGPAGQDSELVSIIAGRNITVNYTGNNPIVGLLNPLSSSVNAGYQELSGTSSDDPNTLCGWSSQANIGGDDAVTTVTHAKPDNTQYNYARIRSQIDTSNVDINYTDTTLSNNFDTTLACDRSKASLSMQATTPGKTSQVEETVLDGRCLRSFTATQGLLMGNKTITVSPTDGINDGHLLNHSIGTNRQDLTLLSNQAVHNQQYLSNVNGLTTIYNTSLACGIYDGATMTLSSLSENGQDRVDNFQQLQTSPATVRFIQSCNDVNAGNNKTTLNTTTTKSSIEGDNEVSVKGGGDATITLNSACTIEAPNTISILSDMAGSLTNPNYIFSAASTTSSYPAIKISRTWVNSSAGEVLGSISSFGRDSDGDEREWGRLQVCADNTTASNQDSTVSIFNSVNGVMTEAFSCSGGTSDNNSYQNLDMNGNAMVTSSGNLRVSTVASSTTGASLILATKDNVVGSGQGLQLTGNTLISTTSGGSANAYLCLNINGSVYKIALLNAS